MHPMILTSSSRRAFMAAVPALVGLSAMPSLAALPQTLRQSLLILEKNSGGRLGVFVLDTGTGKGIGWREDERFGMCSTFKLALAGVILREGDQGRLNVEERIPIRTADVIDHAPIAAPLAGRGDLSLLQLAEATQTTSDNIAANLLLRKLGGPDEFTARLRALGDSVTRQDRFEPDANWVPKGEVRDTTTPRAMSALAAKFLVGNALLPASREKLLAWTRATRTGMKRLRAGLPESWQCGDKTGTGRSRGMPNKHNDIAICFPPQRAPMVITAYYDAPGHFDAMRAQDDAVLAKVGELVAHAVLAEARG